MEPGSGVLGTVIPTVGLLAPSGLAERRKLASELHIRYVVTCHEPGEENLSQSFRADPVNETLVVGTRMGRNDGLATTFVSLDRFPRSVVEAHALADAIAEGGDIDGQRCEVSNERMRNGDWSAAGWRNLKLDEAALLIDRHPMLKRMCDIPGVTMRAPGHGAFYAVFRPRAPRGGFNALCPERGCGHPRLPEQSGGCAPDDGDEAGHGRQDQENPGKRDGCRTGSQQRRKRTRGGRMSADGSW